MAQLLFYLLLLVLQGFLSALLAPLPAPDIFIIALLTLVWRVPPWQFVLLGFGIGLVQDIAGYGNLGLHALGLAASAWVIAALSTVLQQHPLFERLGMIAAACLSKWLVFYLLMKSMGVMEPSQYLRAVAPFELIATLIAASILVPLADWLGKHQGIRRYDSV